MCAVLKPEAVTYFQQVAYFQRVYARMKDAGCDAVVLGMHRDPADHE